MPDSVVRVLRRVLFAVAVASSTALLVIIIAGMV
jgi:hypothetical protein